MYILFLDESGTHANSPCLVVGGFAINEHDAYHLQMALSELLERHLSPLGFDPHDFELHANEVRNPDSKSNKYSPWRQIDHVLRKRLLADAYKVLANFHPENSALPMAAFGVVVESRFRQAIEQEELAYELVLNKFDAMLGRLYRTTGERQRGMVVHDERVVAEKDIQAWTDSWRQAAGKVGQLHNIAEVPLFADSRATRMLQAADLFSYALWRYYGLPAADDRLVKNLWSIFDQDGNEMHGLIHLTPDFAKGGCSCPPCNNRVKNGSARKLKGRTRGKSSGVTIEDIENLRKFYNRH